MSTIDSPHIIADLMRRGGKDPDMPNSLRHTVSTILQYTTGFGNVAYKVFHPLNSNGMSEEECVNIFLETGNILEGTMITFLMREGKVTGEGDAWLMENTPDAPIGTG